MNLYLIPGFGGTSADWDDFSKFLCSSYPRLKTLALSYPPSTTDLISWFAEFLKQQRKPYGLAGYSMGGRLILLAIKKLMDENEHFLLPQYIILLASGLHSENEIERGLRLEKDQKQASLLNQSPSIFWENWYSQEFFASLHTLAKDRISAWVERRKYLNSEELSHQLLSLSPAAHPPLLPCLENLLQRGLSVLYIAGDLDKKYAKLQRDLKEYIPSLHTVLVPQAGHVLLLEAPEICAKAVGELYG